MTSGIILTIILKFSLTFYVFGVGKFLENREAVYD